MGYFNITNVLFPIHINTSPKCLQGGPSPKRHRPNVLSPKWPIAHMARRPDGIAQMSCRPNGIAQMASPKCPRPPIRIVAWILILI